MNRTVVALVILAAALVVSGAAQVRRAWADEEPPVGRRLPGEPTGEIDFQKARELKRRKEKGEKLSPDEEAYLQRAIAEFNRRNNPNGPNRGGNNRGAGPVAPREKTGLIPLCDMTAEDRYQGEDGGLYGKGMNGPTEGHLARARAALHEIRPLNSQGQVDPQGRIAFVSISMSNATQEFSRFKQLADRDEAKSQRLTIVDCAQGGQAMAEWAPASAGPWREANRRIQSAGVSPAQVQVVWIKLANKGPRGDLKEHGEILKRDTTAVIQNARASFPNLRVAYLSSRIYGGYAGSALNPEPYAYESAFVVRWLIQAQVAGDKELNADVKQGPVKAPLLLWGPYLWADGTTPRKSDQLVYARDDLAGDGTHPSEAGRDKVARLMLDFYKTDPLARGWFRGE